MAIMLASLWRRVISASRQSAQWAQRMPLILLADVNAYAVHPDHVAAAGLLKEVKADRACVDYEF